jgi:hypothetical protein
VFSSSISAALSWPFLVHLAAFDASKPLQVVLDQAARSNASLSERWVECLLPRVCEHGAGNRPHKSRLESSKPVGLHKEARTARTARNEPPGGARSCTLQPERGR